MKNSILIILVAICFYNCQNEKNSTPKEETLSLEKTPQKVTSPNTLSELEKEEGWKLLFDGKSTDQWRGYNGDTLPTIGWGIDEEENFIVRPGGQGGDIITKEKFSNFELKMEVMLSDTANSGIFFLVKEVREKSMWYFAPEYQLLDNAAYEGQITDLQKMAANYDMHIAENAIPKPLGEWNTVKIIHNDGKVEHWLNDQKTVDYEINSEDWKTRWKKSKFHVFPEFSQAKKGHIGVQDHNYLVKFRNIKIKKL